MFLYHNNGLSFRAVEDDFQPQDGEVLFPDHATPEELAATFPGYAAAVAAQTTAQTNAAVQAQMDQLDGGGQARAVRSALLAILPAGDEQARLQALETQVATLRAQLVR
jgi:hypothetical protein